MRSLIARILMVGGAVLALASFYTYRPPCTQAANGPFNGEIAFEKLPGSISKMNADGTGQVLLTSVGLNPTWSPDGALIAFEKAFGQIFLMNADGSGQRLLTNFGFGSNFPAWSPDGTKIAFVSESANKLGVFVMNAADGSNIIRLGDSDAQALSWSPDGHQIAFIKAHHIWTMNAADGSGQSQLTTSPDDDHSPSWSPDGEKIAFETQQDIWVMNAADGSGRTPLTNTGGLLEGNPSWSPDGKKIAFDRSPPFVQGQSQPAQIFVMDADGSNQLAVTPNNSVNFRPVWQPLFSPESIGVFRPSTGQWLLRNSNTAGSPDIILNFGQAGDLPVTGDWNGDGRTDIGVFRNGTFFLAVLKTTTIKNCPSCGPITSFDQLPSFSFGQAGDLPTAGDWDGDGIDDVGVFRPGAVGTFLLRQPKTFFFQKKLITSITTISFNFGTNGDRPVAGNWNGGAISTITDRVNTVGVFRPSAPGAFFLGNNFANFADIFFNFGTTGDLPVAGDWNGDGVDGVGIFRPGNTSFFLSNSFVNSADTVFAFGQAGDLPVAGDWKGFNNPPNSGVNDPASGSSSVGQPQTFTTTCSDPDGWHNISTIDFKIAKSDGNGNGVPLALWVQFDEGSNRIRFYDPDSQTWQEGEPGSPVVLSSRFADLYLSGTQVQGSGPTGLSVQVTWSIVFKNSAVMNNYKQYLKITDDAGLTTGFDKVGSWSITK